MRLRIIQCSGPELDVDSGEVRFVADYGGIQACSDRARTAFVTTRARTSVVLVMLNDGADIGHGTTC